MKFKQQWLLRAISPHGESTSLGSVGLFASPEKALAALEGGEVVLPASHYGQAVSVFVPVEAEATEAAAKPAKPAAPPKAKATPPPPAPPAPAHGGASESE